jgi:hypothetical protein
MLFWRLLAGCGVGRADESAQNRPFAPRKCDTLAA